MPGDKIGALTLDGGSGTIYATTDGGDAVPDDRRRRQLADGPRRPRLRRDRDRSERPGDQLRRGLGQHRRDRQERRPRADVDRCRQRHRLDGGHHPRVRSRRPGDAVRGNPRERASSRARTEGGPGTRRAPGSAMRQSARSPSRRDVRTRSSPEPSGTVSSRAPTAASAGVGYRSAFPRRPRRESRPSRSTRSTRTPRTSLPAGAVDASAPASS